MLITDYKIDGELVAECFKTVGKVEHLSDIYDEFSKKYDVSKKADAYTGIRATLQSDSERFEKVNIKKRDGNWLKRK